MKRTLTVVAAVAALLSAAPAAAQAAPVDDKNLCKNGGFANYVDPTTDLPFKNQGRCVSFVNAGGTLVPVEEEPPVPIAPTAKVTGATWLNGFYVVDIELQGQPNTAYRVTASSSEGPQTYDLLTNDVGLRLHNVVVPPETTFTLLDGYFNSDKVLISYTTPAAPTEEPAQGPTLSAAEFKPSITDPAKCEVVQLGVAGLPTNTYYRIYFSSESSGRVGLGDRLPNGGTITYDGIATAPVLSDPGPGAFEIIGNGLDPADPNSQGTLSLPLTVAC